MRECFFCGLHRNTVTLSLYSESGFYGVHRERRCVELVGERVFLLRLAPHTVTLSLYSESGFYRVHRERRCVELIGERMFLFAADTAHSDIITVLQKYHCTPKVVDVSSCEEERV